MMTKENIIAALSSSQLQDASRLVEAISTVLAFPAIWDETVVRAVADYIESNKFDNAPENKVIIKEIAKYMREQAGNDQFRKPQPKNDPELHELHDVWKEM